MRAYLTNNPVIGTILVAGVILLTLGLIEIANKGKMEDYDLPTKIRLKVAVALMVGTLLEIFTQ